MNKKVVIIIILVILIIGGCFGYYWWQSNNQNPNLIITALNGLEYDTSFSSNKIKLTNGIYYLEPLTGKSQDDYFIALEKDNIAIGDINGDNIKDAIVVLKSRAGGSGTFRDLSAVINRNGSYINVDTISLGDRTKINSIVIESGNIIIDLEPYQEDRGIQKYKLENDKLVAVFDIDTSNWKTYRNEKYGFEVKYPQDYIFEDFGSDWFYLGIGEKEEDDPFWRPDRIMEIDIEDDVIDRNYGTTELTFEDFAKYKIKMSCSADGTNAWKLCREPFEYRVYTNKNGIVEHEFYTTQVYETDASGKTEIVSSQKIGPIFVFEINNNLGRNGIFFQIMDRGNVDYESKKVKDLVVILRQIVSTFKIL